MKTFLEYVAEDILKKYGTDLSRVAVVFPNKRASLFLNSHLARMAGKPIWSPAYITISDLFRRHSTLDIADSIKLICDLHKSFVVKTGIDETLDHFYGWGQLLLSDFDDIDKNMADPARVFANIKDIHELDDVSYLTDEHKDMLKKFFRNFTDGHDTELKKRFMKLWCNLRDIFDDYKSRLRSQQLAYEGMLYREVAEDGNTEFVYDRYLFVGFNLLHKVEENVFSLLMKQGKARFYWDFDSYYMKGNNEAGHYIKQYLHAFPNELNTGDGHIYDNLGNRKQMTYVSAPTENIQARYISKWLKENGRAEAGRRTAIVMCNEALLPTVIHCIPENVGKVNVTTGYPLAQAPICSFVSMLILLQTVGYSPSGRCFRLQYVRNVLAHPYMRFISEEGRSLRQRLTENHVYFPVVTDLAVNECLGRLFTPASDNLSLLTWLLETVKTVAQQSDTDDSLMQESVFRTYTLLNRVKGLVASGDLDVDVVTLQRLIKQIFSGASVPFHGEPAVGVQVMGVLETRNLDFDNVLILSCNEGNMPKGVGDSSFIPYSIRKAYGLTTIDNKVDIFAYYFHRLIQRASDVTILYNNSTEDGHTGEMSRFMLQLMVESSHKIERMSLQSGQKQTLFYPRDVPKDEKVMEVLQNMKRLSPTAINRYMRCPLQFYYNNIVGLREPDTTEDDGIDNRIFGNIFHKATELIYSRFAGTIMPGDIEGLLKDAGLIEKVVDRALREELFHITDDRPFRMRLNGLQIINREVIIRYLRRLLEIDMKLAPFTILGTEINVSGNIGIATSDGTSMVELSGYIDRLDLITDRDTGLERIRVIDYKTGNRALTRKVNSVDEIFNPEMISDKHTDYYLQTMLYATIVRNDSNLNADGIAVSPALLFIQHTAGDNYDPTLYIGKDKILDIKEHAEEFGHGITALVSEIYEPQNPFTPTNDKKTCAACPYKQICGS